MQWTRRHTMVFLLDLGLAAVAIAVLVVWRNTVAGFMPPLATDMLREASSIGSLLGGLLIGAAVGFHQWRTVARGARQQILAAAVLPWLLLAIVAWALVSANQSTAALEGLAVYFRPGIASADVAVGAAAMALGFVLTHAAAARTGWDGRLWGRA